MVSRSILRKALYATSALLLSTLGLLAQKIEVEAPNDVEAGRPFNISYVVKGLGNTKASIMGQLSHTGLELLYGPATSRSSSISYVNGQVSASSTLSYTYTLLASSKGSYNIGGFSLELSDGRTLKAPTKTIQAYAGARTQATNAHGASPSRQYHYLAIVGKRSVYEQEPLPITYKLYAQSSFNLVDTKAPVYDGFISHNLKASGATQIMREEYNGQLYNTVEMYKELIYPQKSGRLEIPANKATIQIPLEVDDNPFLGHLIDRTLSTQPLRIEVKPLPEQNKPAEFSGAVGQFTITRSISTQAAKTNEAFSLKLILKGSGNLKMARLPQLNFPSGLEVYPPTDQTEDSQQGSSVTTMRIIEYSIIPRETGRYTLPSVTFAYFDPKTAQYESLQAPGEEIEVSLGKVFDDDAAVVPSATADSQAPPHLLSYHRGTSAPYGLGFASSWLYPLCYGLLILIAWLLGLLGRRELARRADIWGYGANRASSVASKRLKLALRYCKEGKDEAFYEEALRAMWEYVGSKLMLPSSELSRANVQTHLLERGIAQEQVQEWRQTMDDIEFARFAPSSSDSRPSTLYDRAARVIAHIESNIN